MHTVDPTQKYIQIADFNSSEGLLRRFFLLYSLSFRQIANACGIRRFLIHVSLI